MLQIFIGYLFLFINIEINGFDLLPAAAGYILIACGLGKLKNESICFQKARPWAIAMTVLEILSLAELIIQNEISFILFGIMNLAGAGISIYIMYCIVQGIGNIERTYYTAMGYEKLMTVWKAESVLRVAGSLLALIPTEIVALIGVVLAGVGFVVHIIFMVYLNRARKTYDSLPMNPWNGAFPTN